MQALSCFKVQARDGDASPASLKASTASPPIWGHIEGTIPSLSAVSFFFVERYCGLWIVLQVSALMLRNVRIFRVFRVFRVHIFRRHSAQHKPAQPKKEASSQPFAVPKRCQHARRRKQCISQLTPLHVLLSRPKVLGPNLRA